MTWKPDWDGGPPTIVEMEFVESSVGTTLELSHHGFASAEAAANNRDTWLKGLGWLKDYLEPAA